MPAIDDLTAAQLSAASYTPIGYYRTGLLAETAYLGINDVDKRSLPPGWKVDSLRSVYTGNSDNLFEFMWDSCQKPTFTTATRVYI